MSLNNKKQLMKRYFNDPPNAYILKSELIDVCSFLNENEYKITPRKKKTNYYGFVDILVLNGSEFGFIIIDKLPPSYK